MDTAISLISDVIILVFDLTLYMKLTALKKETPLYRGIMAGGAVTVMLLYVLAAYVLGVSYSAASFLCMTLPSFLLFFFLSKYKNARFLVTFCFVDTVTFIIAAIGKLALIVGGSHAGLLSCLVLLVLTVTTYLLIRPYCSRYRLLMDQVAKGWAPMAVSTVFIYILLVFSAAFPKPLAERLEYVPTYLFLCLTILSFYAVFITLIVQKAKLRQANALLQQQQYWHDLAYLDELTHLANSAAYAARTKELQQASGHRDDCGVMIFDLDDFKKINDNYGHHVGNEVLKKAGSFFLNTFPRDQYEFFRVGGDEFAAIVTGTNAKELEAATARINGTSLLTTPPCCYSCGCAMVDFSQEDAFEQALIQADKAMYRVKAGKKKPIRNPKKQK